MIYKRIYLTPDGLDNLMLINKDDTLIKIELTTDNEVNKDKNNDIYFKDTIKWLDMYFNKETPNFLPKYRLDNLVDFQQEVLDIVLHIPYGKTKSYQDIANIIADKHHLKKMSAQAVGHAVGCNPLIIIIPCHRVIGSHNKLGGYHYGLSNKYFLLTLENILDNK